MPSASSPRGGRRIKRRLSTMGTVRSDRDDIPKDQTDWEALRKLSEEEVERRALSDPDARPLTERDFRRLRRSPRVRILRMALGLTQEEFARAYGIPVATLRDWEQGRRQPDQASKTLLKLIERMPREVRAVLAAD
jgi:putative transcriptional regulator